MIGAILGFVLAGICLILSVMQWLEKGFCLNNAYLYASKEEREKMNRTPYYRQSAVVFMLLFLIFVSLALYALTNQSWLMIVEGVALVAVILYAIISSIKIAGKE